MCLPAADMEVWLTRFMEALGPLLESEPFIDDFDIHIASRGAAKG